MSASLLAPGSCRYAASGWGSRAPGIMARRIWRPGTPVMSLITWVHGPCSRGKAGCLGCTCAERSRSRGSRWRLEARRAHRAASGRQEPRSSPSGWRCCIHGPSHTSVLRPGTCCSGLALRKGTATPRAAQISDPGLQEMPVDSRATVVTPQAARQSATASRATGQVWKTRPEGASWSSGPPAYIALAPIAQPAACRVRCVRWSSVLRWGGAFAVAFASAPVSSGVSARERRADPMLG